MKNIKKLICIITAVVALFSITACNGKDYGSYFTEEGLCYAKNRTDGEYGIGIGGIDPDCGLRNAALFVPYKIEGKTVTKLGTSFTGLGVFTNYDLGENLVSRYYAPSTINSVWNGYMSWCDENFTLFYCADKNLDLSLFGLAACCEIYVPFDDYDTLVKNSKKCFAAIKKANIAYMLSENTYYYVDFYETNSKILYIPPVPEKQGYTFGGWHTDKAFTNEWNFETDTILNSKEEIKLYANWIQN